MSSDFLSDELRTMSVGLLVERNSTQVVLSHHGALRPSLFPFLPRILRLLSLALAGARMSFSGSLRSLSAPSNSIASVVKPKAAIVPLTLCQDSSEEPSDDPILELERPRQQTS